MQRGEVWWADLDEPVGSEPGWRHPVVIVQADEVNRSGLRTVVAVIVTTNLHWHESPGNVLLPAGEGGLRRDSVANVSQIGTIDRDFLSDRVGQLSRSRMREIDRGLRLVLGL